MTNKLLTLLDVSSKRNAVEHFWFELIDFDYFIQNCFHSGRNMFYLWEKKGKKDIAIPDLSLSYLVYLFVCLSVF